MPLVQQLRSFPAVYLQIPHQEYKEAVIMFYLAIRELRHRSSLMDCPEMIQRGWEAVK